MSVPFLPALAVGAALLALWIDVRRPSLAPDSLSKRVLAALAAMVALQALPVLQGSALAVYVTVFALLLPALVASFLATLWLMRALRDAQLGTR